MLIAKARFLEVETAVKRLKNQMADIQSAWDSERVHLADLKEQAIRTINRLQQQKRREPKEPNGQPVEKPMNPMAQRILKGMS